MKICDTCKKFSCCDVLCFNYARYEPSIRKLIIRKIKNKIIAWLKLEEVKQDEN